MWHYQDPSFKQCFSFVSGPFVSGVAPWALDVGDTSSDAVFPVLPDGCCDVIWRATGDGAWDARLVPPTTHGFMVPLNAGDRFRGVRLLPGRVRELFDVSVLDIPPAGISLGQTRWHTPEEGRLHINAQGSQEQSEDPLVLALMLGLSPAEVCRKYGVRARTLHRRVYAISGCSPKVLQRIWRLRRAITRSVHDPAPNWCDIALQAGYADQPHMIRNCRALMGCNPVKLHGMLTESEVTVSFNP